MVASRYLGWRVVLLLGLSLAYPTPEMAQDIDPESLAPGLVAEYGRAPDAPSMGRRVEARPTHDWGDGRPDARLGSGAFYARYKGWLLTREPGPHRFVIDSGGDARLVLDGRLVAEGRGLIHSEPIDLAVGLVPFRLEYRHADEQPARLSVSWEGPGFAREPLPAHLLYHPGEAEAAPIDRFEAGRRLADRLGCANCHRVLDLPSHPDLGPPLADAGTAIDAGWLADWLRDPVALRPLSAMPSLGDHGLDFAAATDLAAFLREHSRPAAADPAELRMALNLADPTTGRKLFRSSGCLACHTRTDDETHPPGPAHPRGVIDLSDLPRKRDSGWVARFLARSGKDGPSPHRPDLRLDPEAAAHLAAYLAGGGTVEVADAGDADRGRRLAEAARCAACHLVPGLDRPRIDLPLGPGSDPRGGCLADEGRAPLEPRFGLDDEERETLRRFVADLPDAPARTADETRATDDLRRRGCNGCHARDGQGGERLGEAVAAYLASDPQLGSLKGRINPPSLTSVGAKLRPEFLDQAVRGEAPPARPWLALGMPRFAFEPGEAERIASHFRAMDQPSSEPDRSDRGESASPVDRDRASALIGQRGFGCVSCHVVAGRVPPGAEPETMGPDLALSHQRMPEAYFRRWLADPQRILPGTPMPRFEKPAPGLPGTLNDQLGTIWAALGDDPSALLGASTTRQVRRPVPGRAEVVHDMVVLDEGGPGASHRPRGLAIGLSNGRSVLFDADRLAWVAAWHGGFLARTKSGRLWEWHLDGVIDWRSDGLEAPVSWVGPDGRSSAPTLERERFGRFVALRFEGESVTFQYELHGPDGIPVQVRERVGPLGEGGWVREVKVEGLPEGYRPLVAGPPGDGPPQPLQADGLGGFQASREFRPQD